MFGFQIDQCTTYLIIFVEGALGRGRTRRGRVRILPATGGKGSRFTRYRKAVDANYAVSGLSKYRSRFSGSEDYESGKINYLASLFLFYKKSFGSKIMRTICCFLYTIIISAPESEGQ